MSQKNSLTWFITGCSSGFGRELTRVVLDRGYRAAVILKTDDVVAVCHGPAIMPGIIDSKTGKSIIHGKTVTGFSIEGELIFRILDKLRADGVVLIVEAVTAAGAFYSGLVVRLR